MTNLEEWWPWVWGVAKRVARKHRRWSAGELASWGYDGLVSGLRCYREQPGWPLKRYLGYRVAGAMVDGLRQTRWQLLPESECPVDNLPGIQQDNTDFDELVAMVRPRLRPLLVGYYRDGLTLKDLAKTHSISEARVCQLLQEAREEIKKRCLTPETSSHSVPEDAG